MIKADKPIKGYLVPVKGSFAKPIITPVYRIYCKINEKQGGNDATAAEEWGYLSWDSLNEEELQFKNSLDYRFVWHCELVGHINLTKVSRETLYNEMDEMRTPSELIAKGVTLQEVSMEDEDMMQDVRDIINRFFLHIDSTPETPMYGGHRVHCKVNYPISSDTTWFGVISISLRTTDDNRVMYNNVNDGSKATLEIHSRIETHASDPNWEEDALPNIPNGLGTRKRTMHINDIPWAIVNDEVAKFIVECGYWELIS